MPKDICYEGHIVSRRCALRLLEKVLNNDDVELAGELVRFLGPTPRSPELRNNKPEEIERDGSDAGSPSHPHYSSDSKLIDIGITPDDEEYCIFLSSSLKTTFTKFIHA